MDCGGGREYRSDCRYCEEEKRQEEKAEQDHKEDNAEIDSKNKEKEISN